ncbi:exosome non-catalytic core subunit RRP45 [Sugiyamaella lignohabitans]|uniref:Exosome complex component RRP45 n=1 Tax=Sugiyamaella lignohabitans TaxID=796027 RepID=A0A167CR44_9ASCO|nr:exosome non-catalytic core subunit RRP45 [Sugiyamaella lignohabitans]ANB12006.1 exosome non-catalytic core subunit RRP45 [Sugiyamaella lignohabitans]
MPKRKDISLNERQFILSLLKDSQRLDGRAIDQFRKVDLKFGDSLGHAEVQLGKTRLVVRVSAEVSKPYEDRPYEGTFIITTDVSSMASPLFENNRSSDDEMLMTRLIEKAIRRSNALDLESLCIVAGKSCWMIRADVHYLSYDGGLVDASCIGVIAALMHFRRPDTSIDGDQTIIHSVEERVPVPLSILHVPICVTFSFFKVDEVPSSTENPVAAIPGSGQSANGVPTADDSAILVIDATAQEEALRHSELTITINKNRDICQIAKPGGYSVEALTILECANKAYKIATNITDLIYRRLKEDESKRNAGNLVPLTAENER